MWSPKRKKLEMPTPEDALRGRTTRLTVPAAHFVNGHRLEPPYPAGLTTAEGMRQGNDVGTQYRSGIYVNDDAERKVAEASRDVYAAQLAKAGYGAITTEIQPAPEFYFAEDYHQQYLAKNLPGTVAWVVAESPTNQRVELRCSCTIRDQAPDGG